MKNYEIESVTQQREAELEDLLNLMRGIGMLARALNAAIQEATEALPVIEIEE